MVSGLIARFSGEVRESDPQPYGEETKPQT